MRTFKIKDPSTYLNYENWISGFANFYEAAMLIYKLENLDTRFSKSNNYELVFLDSSLAQILSLKKMSSINTLNKYLRSESSEFRNLVKIHAKNILSSTITKLSELKISTELNGWESLNHRPYSIYKARSVESYGMHRIIYNMNELPYRVTITSVLGHYNDSPEDALSGIECKLETCIMDIYRLMSPTFINSDYQEARKYLNSKL